VKIWPLSDRKTEKGKGYSNFLNISPHFIFNSVEINDWTMILPFLVNVLSGIETACSVSPTQSLAILAVDGSWAGQRCFSESLVFNSS